MPKFDAFNYALGYYGQKSLLGFSVQPFTAIVIDYDKVELTWAALSSTFNAVRLVRNQVTLPETAEDGVILWEETGLSGTFSRTTYVDGLDNFIDGTAINNAPLINGRFAYYRMWLRKDDNVWYEAGDTYALIPKDHGATAFPGTVTQSTHEKFLDLLPKVFTSANQSSLDPIDLNSTLSTFLSGFSLTLDELLSFGDALKPSYSGLSTPPQLIGSLLHQYGLPKEYALSLRALKRLVREASFLRNNKGTALGIQTLAESITGFAPTVTVTTNLMLTMQDSTFYKGVGNWSTLGDCVLSSSTDTATPSSVTYAADQVFTGKAVVSTANAAITNGLVSPNLTGVPVTAGTAYQFSFYVKSSASSANVTPKIFWYDYLGNAISSVTYSGTASVTSSWSRVSFENNTAPTGAAFAGLQISFGTTGTYYVDMIQVAQYVSANTPVFQEARGAVVSLAPSKINYLDNPSFDVLNSSWTIVDSSHSLVDSDYHDAVDASKMLHSVTNTSAVSSYTSATTAALPVGSFYTFSLSAQTTSGTENMTLTISASDGTLTASTDVAVSIGTAWDRFSTTVYVPATFNASTTVITVSLHGTTAGHTLNLDGAQLEPTYSPTDYFDGSFPAAYGAGWSGATDQSYSYMYPNKAVRVPRLIANLATFLPVGTPYYVSTQAGLEYVGIA